jgi:hypothetical protein
MNYIFRRKQQEACITVLVVIALRIEFPALAYRSKWANGWAKEWFRMKNDLTARDDISAIIKSPIVTSFGFKKPTCYVNFEA